MTIRLDLTRKKTFVACVKAMEQHVARLKEFLINCLDQVSEMGEIGNRNKIHASLALRRSIKNQMLFRLC